LTSPSDPFSGLGVLIKRNIIFGSVNPRKNGGLGLKNLYKFNRSVMCKLWWKLENGYGPWKNMMRQKYLRGGGVFYTKNKPGDSPL
jgi:hypothetical protein